MRNILKYKIPKYVVVVFIVFAAASITLVLKQTALADNSTPLCFYQPTGIVYNCSDVSPEEASGFTSGDCYINNGALNAQGNIDWQQTDCSNAVFSGGATCPPQGAPSGYSCTIKSKSQINTCPSGSTGCDSLVSKYINPFINFLAAGVGIIVTVMIVIGGIQYSASQDNPQAVQAARKRIANAVLALLAFALMWAFLQWIVPGGIFNG